MKKYLNNPDAVVDEMIEGFLAIHGNKFVQLPTSRVLVRKEVPIKGKVAVVTGGGSGHKPAFIGYLGDGMVDAVAVGDIFSSPSAQQIYDAIKATDSGAGVLCILGNYSGDVMNFEMAIEMATEDSIAVEQVIVNDDVGSAPKDKRDNRRGVVGEVVAWKIAGAQTKQGASLSEVKETVERAVFNTRSFGVAHAPCTLPTSDEPTFTLKEGEMEIGVGHHGEPGVKKMPMKSANETTSMLMDKILEDLPFTRGDEVAVIINGLGATSLLELHIIYRKVHAILQHSGISVHRTYIGEFFTSLEMAGFSITLTKLDPGLKQLLDVPANAALFTQV